MTTRRPQPRMVERLVPRHQRPRPRRAHRLLRRSTIATTRPSTRRAASRAGRRCARTGQQIFAAVPDIAVQASRWVADGAHGVVGVGDARHPPRRLAAPHARRGDLRRRGGPGAAGPAFTSNRSTKRRPASTRPSAARSAAPPATRPDRDPRRRRDRARSGTAGRSASGRRGLAVRVLTRDAASRRARQWSTRLQFVHGDVRDPASLARAMAGVDTVVSAVHGFAGSGNVTPASVDRDGNAHLIAAARSTLAPPSC